MKACTKCGETKSPSEFYKKTRSRDGLEPRCKECILAKNRRNYAENRGCKKEQNRRWRAEHSDRMSELNARWRADNRERSNANQRWWQAGNRSQAIAAYGGECVHCGATDSLEFDHVCGGGNEHRKVESADRLYRRIARDGPIGDYRLQLLCHKCHISKTRGDKAVAL